MHKFTHQLENARRHPFKSKRQKKRDGERQKNVGDRSEEEKNTHSKHVLKDVKLVIWYRISATSHQFAWTTS